MPTMNTIYTSISEKPIICDAVCMSAPPRSQLISLSYSRCMMLISVALTVQFLYTTT